MKRLAILLVVLMACPSIAAGGQQATVAPDARAVEAGAGLLQMASGAAAPPGIGPAARSTPAPRANATDYSDVLVLINDQSLVSMDLVAPHVMPDYFPHRSRGDLHLARLQQ